MSLREMCYLCSQRAARNVPVYFREQEEKEERENAKILSLAEQRKAEEEIQNSLQLLKLRLERKQLQYLGVDVLSQACPPSSQPARPGA